MIQLTDINKCIDQAEKANLEFFYLEIIAAARHRQKKKLVKDQNQKQFAHGSTANTAK